jgi:hypothetical protein
MYRATKKLFAFMSVMGHTTVSTTMKYQHQNIDEVAEVASHRDHNLSQAFLKTSHPGET